MSKQSTQSTQSKQIVPWQVPFPVRHRATFCSKYAKDCALDESIKKCYYRNALRLHPDRHPGRPEAWYTMKESYDTVDPEKRGLTCEAYKNALFDEYNETLAAVLMEANDLPAEFRELLEDMLGNKKIFEQVKDIEPAPPAEVKEVLGDMPPQSKSMKWAILKWIGIALIIFAVITAAVHYSSTNTVPLNQQQTYLNTYGCAVTDKACYKSYLLQLHPDKPTGSGEAFMNFKDSYQSAMKYHQTNKQRLKMEQFLRS